MATTKHCATELLSGSMSSRNRSPKSKGLELLRGDPDASDISEPHLANSIEQLIWLLSYSRSYHHSRTVCNSIESDKALRKLCSHMDV